jgi:hypothetical protein
MKRFRERQLQPDIRVHVTFGPGGEPPDERSIRQVGRSCSVVHRSIAQQRRLADRETFHIPL